LKSASYHFLNSGAFSGCRAAFLRVVVGGGGGAHEAGGVDCGLHAGAVVELARGALDGGRVGAAGWPGFAGAPRTIPGEL